MPGSVVLPSVISVTAWAPSLLQREKLDSLARPDIDVLAQRPRHRFAKRLWRAGYWRSCGSHFRKARVSQGFPAPSSDTWSPTGKIRSHISAGSASCQCDKSVNSGLSPKNFSDLQPLPTLSYKFAKHVKREADGGAVGTGHRGQQRSERRQRRQTIDYQQGHG